LSGCIWDSWWLCGASSVVGIPGPTSDDDLWPTSCQPQQITAQHQVAWTQRQCRAN